MRTFSIPVSTRAFLGIILSVVSAICARADAPDTFSDVLYYETINAVAVRLHEVRSIKLSTDGSYRENWVRIGSVLGEVGWPYQSPYATPTSGTYTYTKTSLNTGTLILTPSNGQVPVVRQLSFIDSGLGTVNVVSGDVEMQIPNGTFYYTEHRTVDRPLINVSTRAHVHPGEPTIVGFIVGRAGDFLIRVSGPALNNYSVADFWPAPSFRLYAGSSQLVPWADQKIASHDQPPPTWDANKIFQAMNSQAFAATGAAPFAAGSKDIAAVVPLVPGGITIVLQPDTNDAGGEVLVEVQEIP